ncbi:phosphatidic acid phosphatase [Plasmopara halstedii]|uniref:Phosphatidic acid phosphatase n=1 Tax=Plasmopara halstedii TaxID=4781 RepID=A0A0P1AVH2_PLAHL|nr:phosphatidic acid phosphatase [Plasmopara halstedii]CEG45207.1 phosphatidic acid phosphatase [Plasmopara halstedii]|eukprot:XP_024581576.1 phosphatidic acid phosphatase [Plasmopara halstedii]
MSFDIPNSSVESSMVGNGKSEATSEFQFMPSPPPAPSALPGRRIPINEVERKDPTEEFDDTPIHIAEAGAIRPARSGSQRFIRRYRILEFGSAAILYLLGLVFARIEVHERPIPSIKVRLNAAAVVWSLDPSIDEIKLPEEVPMWLLLSLGIGLPIGSNLIMNYVLPRICQVRIIPHDTRDFLLSLFQSTALATFLTQFTKNITGRFRPSFYDMCKWNYDIIWDGVTDLCTDAAGDKEGRKSFPSGHASFAWSSMLVLALYLLGRSRLNSANRSNSTLRGAKSSFMLFVCCSPILLAAWISITRCIDNWHHYSDILAGSVIGSVAAIFAFSYNYGSIFSHDLAGLPLEEIHERRMIKAKKARNEQLDMSPMLGYAFESRPPFFKQVSSDYIVDLSNRSQESSLQYQS